MQGKRFSLADEYEPSEADESRIAEDVDGDSGSERSLLGPPGTSEIHLQQQPHSTPSATLLSPLSHPPPAPPIQQQSSSSSVIRWERFLPFRSLKVLLVENDDSTRHVLSALLRNCSYEVTAAANGLEAWKFLEDLSNHVDIVLTEVIMPGLSGIGLLCRIVNHKTCQNVPVIMMSSHDSMGLVFKCLSKGAVDFLIKPIRKNELKNLWQHVWRRCHSSSGSGSESGIQKHRNADESGSDSDSGHENEDTSIGLNMQDGSDNGSGTQSSWRKHAADFEIPQPGSQCNQLPEPFSSTCAQVIHPRTRTFCNEWIAGTGVKDLQKEEILDQDILQKDSEVWMPKESDNQPNSNPSENDPHSTLGSLENVPHITLGSQTDIYQKTHLPINNHQNTDSSPQAARFTRTLTSSDKTLHSQVEVPDNHTNIGRNREKTFSNMKGPPSLQLNMNNLTYLAENGTVTNDDQNLLRHSDLSAFTRYNASAAWNHVPEGCLGNNCSTDDTNSEAIKLDFLSKDAPLNQGSNSNNNDMGLSTQNISKVPGTEQRAAIATVQGSHSSYFHSVQKRNPPIQEVLQEKNDHFEADASAIIDYPRVFHHVEPGHHIDCQHHHHVHMQQLPSLEHEEPLTHIESNVPQCGSSNVLAGGLEFITANYSVNGSVSGSNHGSNSLNGGSAMVNVGRMNIDDDSGLAIKCGTASGNEDQSARGNAHEADRSRSRQTKALLSKFRKKRKERCFEKKGQYQSRKKSAEHRQRVCEQFIPQPISDQENSGS